MSHGFLREFLKSPSTIGAVAPSSNRLARAIVSDMGIEAAAVIAEYGPGIGTFTSVIQARRNPDGFFFAVEKNHRMAQSFKKRFPNVPLFEESAENLPSILARVGKAEVDCIVSGLPWTVFSPDLQNRLLDTTFSALKKGGSFTTFVYLHTLFLPSGRRFRKRLHDVFPQVHASRVVWGNLPPAFVYCCVK